MCVCVSVSVSVSVCVCVCLVNSSKLRVAKKNLRMVEIGETILLVVDDVICTTNWRPATCPRPWTPHSFVMTSSTTFGAQFVASITWSRMCN